MTIVSQLWESLPPEAIVADAASSTYVDALFTSHWTKPSAQEFYTDVKQYASQKWHRDPEKLLVVPGVYPILGATEAEARQRKADLDDQLDLEYLKGSLAELLGVAAADLDLSRELPYGKIPPSDPASGAGHVRREKIVESARERGVTTRQVVLEYITGGHRIVVGAPEQIADDLIDRVAAQAPRRDTERLLFTDLRPELRTRKIGAIRLPRADGERLPLTEFFQFIRESGRGTRSRSTRST